VRHRNYYTIANSNLLHISISGMPAFEAYDTIVPILTPIC